MLRTVYPDAPTDAPIQIYRPHRNVFDYAQLWRFTKIVTTVCAIVGSVGLVLMIIWASTTDSTTGDATSAHYHHSVLELAADVLFLGSIAVMVVFAIVRAIIASNIGVDHRSTWTDVTEFMEARGFTSHDPASWERLPVPAFDKLSSVEIHSLFGGHLAEGIPALVGIAEGDRINVNLAESIFDRFQYNPDDEHEHFVFIYSLLPPHVQSIIPGSSFVRVSRPMSTWLDLEGRELEFESIRVDTSTHISVEGNPTALVWRQLFGPQFLAGLAETHDVQWQQHGSVMVFFAPSTWFDDLIFVEEFDTLASGAAFVLRHYLDTVERMQRALPRSRRNAA